MKEFWRNIYHSVMLQKWRSIMTAFGVFWGILILIIMLGVGKGTKQGATGRMVKIPRYIEIDINPTSLEYKGYPIGRKWSLDNRGIEILEEKYKTQILAAAKVLKLGEQSMTDGIKHSTYQVDGISPEYVRTFPQAIISGRAINKTDVENQRMVCVLGEDVANYFEAKVGDLFKINDATYTVVGINRCLNGLFAEENNPKLFVYMPISTAQLAFGYGTKFNGVVINMNEGYSAIEYEPVFDCFLREYYGLHPDDLEVMDKFNSEQFIVERNSLKIGMDILLWLIGIGTLVAGLIGIANIMLVSIKERTQEIGIYRAIGAQPSVIIKMILGESLFLTLSSGITGLAVGIYSLALIRKALALEETVDSIVSNPYIPVGIAIAALIILVAGGLVAGYIPIRNALKIKAIEALRSE